MLFTPFQQSDIRLPKHNFDSGIKMTYLGTAGFIFSSESRNIVVDPFVTRMSKFDTLFRPLLPNAEKIASLIPKADDVLIGHSHHDHILDSPELCRQTGARFIGSPDACRVARAAKVPDAQILETIGREDIPCGEHSRVRGFPSVHGRVYFNKISMPGMISDDFQWPARLLNFRHGLVFNWSIEMNGLRIVHIDSADFLEEEIKDLRCDILCLCAIGRKFRPNYVRDAVRIMQPKVVIACHWDCFWIPFEGKHRQLPQVNLKGFVQEIEKAGAEPAVVPIGHSMML